MSVRTLLDGLAWVLIFVSLVASVVIWRVAPDYFTNVYAAEDRLVENGTALFLLFSGLVLLQRAYSLRARAVALAVVLTAFYGLIFMMAAGEEISWGQRIFGWGTPEFFARNNYQNETNLHNLQIGNVRLSKTVFGPWLTVIMLCYLVGLPLVYTRSATIRWLADRLAVPVPWPRHSLIAILASIVVAMIDVRRNWEVYELVFALLTFSIFLRPQSETQLRIPPVGEDRR